MPNRGILFVNPRSGSLTSPVRGELAELARAAGLTVHDISPALDIRAIVGESLRRGANAIVVAGGDGSVHHAAQALVRTEAVLGIVPVGSINHLARDLGIPMDWKSAFEIAISGEIRQIDTARINGIHFLNSAMFGLFPTMSAYRERFRETHSKWRAYLRASRLALRQFPHVALVVELGGRIERIRTQMFAVAVNSYDLSHGGIVVPKRSLDDGRLTVYSLSFMGRRELVRAAARYFRGRIEGMPGFRQVRTGSLTIHSAHHRVRIALDGELVELAPPLQIVADPSSLLVRGPEPSSSGA